MKTYLWPILCIVAICVSQTAAQSVRTVPVGEQVCFTVAAVDSSGDTIRNWNTMGTPITLTLMNSTANTDTSWQSWNGDSDGYTYAVISKDGQPLTLLPPNQWTIPPSDFVDGKVK